jgi:hypothetical protein
MPETIPNLAGVATKDLVETIGAGNFKASYINWARTFNLLHQYAPGWYLEMVTSPEGSQVWKAPGIGGSLMLRFCHIDGTVLAPVPQSIMDNRNTSIPFEKISSRDITDTHRRGGCMCAAMTFGLAHELWAKMPLESGYSEVEVVGEKIVVTETTAQKEPTKEDFLEAALKKGLSTHAAESLLGVINGNYRNGIKTLGLKDDAWVAEQNKSFEPEAPQKPAPAARAKKTPAKADPSEY